MGSGELVLRESGLKKIGLREVGSGKNVLRVRLRESAKNSCSSERTGLSGGGKRGWCSERERLGGKDS